MRGWRFWHLTCPKKYSFAPWKSSHGRSSRKSPSRSALPIFSPAPTTAAASPQSSLSTDYFTSSPTTTSTIPSSSPNSTTSSPRASSSIPAAPHSSPLSPNSWPAPTSPNTSSPPSSNASSAPPSTPHPTAHCGRCASRSTSCVDTRPHTPSSTAAIRRRSAGRSISLTAARRHYDPSGRPMPMPMPMPGRTGVAQPTRITKRR
mmetsp:Transcript_23921/g.58342  ORF Transcript_23921/g.58342 Transcript_23921/m.58342 type:complete len:204 (-) Transcript_23921:125-736(-)